MMLRLLTNVPNAFYIQRIYTVCLLSGHHWDHTDIAIMLQYVEQEREENCTETWIWTQTASQPYGDYIVHIVNFRLTQNVNYLA